MPPDLSKERLAASIVAKSDQLTYEDFVPGPKTFTVAGAAEGTPEQPVNIRLVESDRPWRPSKTMRRVLCLLWGFDAHEWVGRSITLYGDPEVTFGKIKVGGIKISHLSNIDGAQTVNVTISKGRKGPVTVMELKTAASPAPANNHAIDGAGLKPMEWINAVKTALEDSETPRELWEANLDVFTSMTKAAKTEVGRTALSNLQMFAVKRIKAVEAKDAAEDV